MKRYHLGVDVGGTKTQALVVDQEGRIVGEGLSGAGNYESVGFDGLQAALDESVIQAFSTAGIVADQIAGAGFGVAGYDWPSELPPTLEVIKTLGLSCPIKVVNDTIIGLVAGADLGWGVAVVAGTGCNCIGRDKDGRQGRVTGEGGMFGEFGGAGEIVGKAIQQVAYAHYQRGPQTRLTGVLVEACGAKDAADLMEGLVMDWYHLDAGLAPKIFSTAEEGDKVARNVIIWAGRELGQLAVCVIRQLKLESTTFEVIMVGSVFSGGALLLDSFTDTIHAVAPGALIKRLSQPPVIGAVLLGMEAAGVDIAVAGMRERMRAGILMHDRML